MRDRRQLVAEGRPCPHDAGVGEVPKWTLTVCDCPRAEVIDEVIAVKSTERAAERVKAGGRNVTTNTTPGTSSQCRAMRTTASRSAAFTTSRDEDSDLC